MGAFMPVDKALKYRWRSVIVGSENNRTTTAIPDGHTSRYVGAPSATLDEADRFPFIIGTRWRINDFIRRACLCVLPDRCVGKGHAQCQTNSRKNGTQFEALQRHRIKTPSLESL
jgi:hypothetical protein